MSRFILPILLAAGLAACTPAKRVGPPAPIVTIGKAVPERPRVKSTPKPKQPKPAAPSPRKEKVEVYAYRPPASAPDAPPSQSVVPTEKAPGTDIDKRTADASAKKKTPEKAPPVAVTPPLTPPAPVPLPPLPPVAVPKLSPAASTLVEQAEQQRRAKDYMGAAATLERALGIQPQEPYIWNRLARVRIEQGLHAQASNLASRSNALAGKQIALKRDNWIIIATARKAAGNLAGSREAWRQARGG